MRKLFIRSGVTIFWILLIFSALYWPRWKPMHYDAKTLNIFAWGDILDPAVLADFEKESGIKLNLSYYSSNEELVVKLKATKGEGYDLIIPSDYAVNILIKENLLKKFDKNRFNYWKTLNPNLLGRDFDPHNAYSIPFEWELYGLGIDKDYFREHPTPPSWAMIFDPKVMNYKITMNNDPIEAVEFAAFYLYGEATDLTPQQADEVRQLLIDQKKYVAAYVNFRGDYFLATKNVAVVLASSSYIWRTKRLFDFVGFVVPQEGSFITIENLCIPRACDKEEMVFKLINYLCSPKSAASHFETYGFFPANLNAADVPDMDEDATRLMHSTSEDFKKYHFVRNTMPEDEIRDIWVDVKNGDF